MRKVLAIVVFVSIMFSLPQTMTYQGKLVNSSGLGICDTLPMTFKLYTVASGGLPIWEEGHTGINEIVVSKGLFTVELGSIDPFDLGFDNDYYLEITVDGDVMSPRQTLSTSAYSFRTAIADSLAGGAGDDWGDQVINSDASLDGNGTVSSALTIARQGALDGEVLKWDTGLGRWFPGTDETGGGGSLWEVLESTGEGDSVIVPVRNLGLMMKQCDVLGYDAATHVCFGVACTTGMDGIDRTYITLSGGYGNAAACKFNTIAGGDRNKTNNVYATISGGRENIADGIMSQIGGGWSNRTYDSLACVLSGRGNKGWGKYSVVLGGGGSEFTDGNTSYGTYSFIGNGMSNSADSMYSVVVNGENNYAGNKGAFIGSGLFNRATASQSAVVSGYGNHAYGRQAFVGSGNVNYADGLRSFVGGGQDNVADGSNSAIAGGVSNSVTLSYSFIGGGHRNKVHGNYSSIVGGGSGFISDSNSVYSDYSIIGGGAAHRTRGDYSGIFSGNTNRIEATANNSVIAGGTNNTISGQNSSISGGHNSIAVDDYSHIGGGNTNSANGSYAVIAGGRQNNTHGTGTVVGGGKFNSATDSLAAVLSGMYNRADGKYSVVCGGGGPDASDSNSAAGHCSFIGGGRHNRTADIYATVSGGVSNDAMGPFSFIGGGNANDAFNGYSAVICGVGNDAFATYSTVLNGNSNTAGGHYSTVAGGSYSRSAGLSSFIGAGQYNKARGAYSAIIAGGGADEADSNTVKGDNGIIGAGKSNTIGLFGYTGFIGAGTENSIIDSFSVVVGGSNNSATGKYAVVCGGGGAASEYGNTASGLRSFVGGGLSNEASGSYSAIPGGKDNIASGYASIALGENATVTGANSFLWNDGASPVTNGSGTCFMVSAANGSYFRGSNSLYALRGDNSGTGDGVWATNSGNSSYSAGLYANNTAAGWGIYCDDGTEGAGYFNGSVEINGNIAKSGGSFKIDHPLDPENKYLYHSFVESPDMKNIYDGVVTLNALGKATIDLPDWFSTLNGDFRYQLTCIGGHADVYISEELKDNAFSIAGGKSGMKVSWQVTGIRKDPWAENNRIPVERDKEDWQKGRYIHPKLYGQPEEKGIYYRPENDNR